MNLPTQSQGQGLGIFDSGSSSMLSAIQAPLPVPTILPAQGQPAPGGKKGKKSKDDDDPNYTTVMLRNIPNKYSRTMLIEEINRHGFQGEIDYMYLPTDFTNRCNVGYCFCNFRTAAARQKFQQLFDSVPAQTCLPGFNSYKVCQVTRAKWQGRAENVKRLRSSPELMQQLAAHPEWLPLLMNAKAVQERAIENIDSEKKTLLTTISVAVENMADNIFATVQGHHAKIADNYLSLKAYAQSAADDIEDYMKKGKTKGLSSVGDLLSTLAETAGEAPPAATEGEGFGAESIPSVFSGKEVKVDGSVSKINGLVNEYVGIVGQVKDRWPMGLGKYLIGKLEIAMQNEGVLEVDKITGKAGNFVFMNAHSVGLSSKLSDFEGLAVSMRLYEQTLAGLTGGLSDKAHAGQQAKVHVPPPQWQGD